jgi:lysophospholipase L1-like esterase
MPENTFRVTAPKLENAYRPTLFLIGGSSLCDGDGANGQWGLGGPLAGYFDGAKIDVINRAAGGLSSRTCYMQGQWQQVLAMLKPGDFVLIEFGDSDREAIDDPAHARGTLPGTSDETRAIDNPVTKRHEVVHTYGWYLKRFIEETRARGATPIVCSPVPRKIWQSARIARDSGTYEAWAREVAIFNNAPFIDLNEIVARRYDALGPAKVEPLFANDVSRSSRAGAELNAERLVAGLKGLTIDPLAPYFSAKAAAVAPFTP